MFLIYMILSLGVVMGGFEFFTAYARKHYDFALIGLLVFVGCLSVLINVLVST